MPRGRPPISPELKKLRGNPGKRAIPDPIKPAGQLAAPKNLRKEAQVVWKMVVGAMPLGTYASTDAISLGTFCEAVADYWDACEAVRTLGRYDKGSTGQTVISAAAKDKSELARLIYTLGQRLYLDPVARASIMNGPEKKEDDPFANLIN